MCFFIFSFFLRLSVSAQDLPPPPTSINLADYTLDDVSRLMVGAMQATHKAEEDNLKIVAANKTLSARIVILGLSLEKEEAANEKLTKDAKEIKAVFKKKDAEISDLKESIHKWKVFGNVILVILFTTTAALTLFATKTPPLPLWARIALSLLAGTAASSGLFYVITHLIP